MLYDTTLPTVPRLPIVLVYTKHVLRKFISINQSLLSSHVMCFLSFVPRQKGLHKTFSGTTKKCENKNLSYFLFQYNFLKCAGREGLIFYLHKVCKLKRTKKSKFCLIYLSNDQIKNLPEKF